MGWSSHTTFFRPWKCFLPRGMVRWMEMGAAAMRVLRWTVLASRQLSRFGLDRQDIFFGGQRSHFAFALRTNSSTGPSIVVPATISTIGIQLRILNCTVFTSFCDSNSNSCYCQPVFYLISPESKLSPPSIFHFFKHQKILRLTTQANSDSCFSCLDSIRSPPTAISYLFPCLAHYTSTTAQHVRRLKACRGCRSSKGRL